MGAVPIPTAGGGGRGIGGVPIPTTGGGGSGMGAVPMPKTLRRIDTLLSTTRSASTNAKIVFFMGSPPGDRARMIATWREPKPTNFYKSI